jgi:hypothetical protein
MIFVVGIVSRHANSLLSSSRTEENHRDADTRLGVGALSLDVTSLLALVADLLTSGGLLGAVARVVAGLATVVALHAVDALPGHVAVAAARVAGLASTATEAARPTRAARAAVARAATEAATGAVAGNVADLAALVQSVSCR